MGTTIKSYLKLKNTTAMMQAYQSQWQKRLEDLVQRHIQMVVSEEDLDCVYQVEECMEEASSKVKTTDTGLHRLFL